MNGKDAQCEKVQVLIRMSEWYFNYNKNTRTSLYWLYSALQSSLMTFLMVHLRRLTFKLGETSVNQEDNDIMTDLGICV